MVSVLIIGSNSYFTTEMSSKLSAYNDISGVSVATCAEQAEVITRKEPPGVLIIESGANESIECYSGLWEKTAMRVILISDVMNDETISRAVTSGVTYCMVKPVSVRLLHDRVKMVASCCARKAKALRLPRRVAPSAIDSLLDDFGINFNCVGYAYLRYGVAIAMKKPNNGRLMLTKDVYPRIAREFNTTRACAERAMRSCINSAWEKRHNESSLMLRFNQRPSNSLFIAVLVRMLPGEAG